MIAFIDTEVSEQSQQVRDFGAVREDGAKLHTHSADEFDAFVKECDCLCGHNILNFDIKYIKIQGSPLFIDTLYLSPLMFPNKPYHRLVKDDKLQVDDPNNPLNDAIKARDLFYDEVETWQQLSPARKEIYYHLLHKTTEFGGFFSHLAYSPSTRQSNTLLGRMLFAQPNLSQLIVSEYSGKICRNVDIDTIATRYPIELAYALAIVGAEDLMSITPAWVMRNYPAVGNVINLLRNTPCGECEYCRQQLDAHHGLSEFFGYDEFRLFDGKRMQEEAVETAIRGESLLCIFPTGGGKSLTFQLPALMAGHNTHGLTVVISPLQSLMKDQVDNLAARGISEAVTINGLLDPIERANAIQQVAEGAANLLYIAPEMLRNKTIERLLLGRNVIRFVIDEAHCFSAWGQDFRVDYLYIGDFIRNLQELKQRQEPIAVSCFTATAKQKVISDICDYFKQKLGLDLKVFAANAERKNLRYSVIHAESTEEKYNLLRSLILGRHCPTIVYVSRTKRTRELSEHLRADGIRALPFNGKMEPQEKIHNQDAFMNGEAQVVVATSAFGMGVDKKDVGLVVHYDISDSLENYVQEAGRAGRDPQMEAECYVLYSDNDLDKHFILLNQTKLSLSEIQQVWKAIKDLTAQRPTVSCSPLEIARQAGWSEEIDDIDTRVKAAIAALENAGFIQRGNNMPHVFATGITVSTMDEARRRLNLSPLFDDTTREEAARIIHSLISRRATTKNKDEAESRTDYLADVLGMENKTVIRNINLMRQEGLLADSRDMQAWIAKSSIRRELDNTLRLEQFVLTHLKEAPQELNYKELNEEAQAAGISFCTVRRLKTLFHFLTLTGYIRKKEHPSGGSVNLWLQTSPEATLRRFERRMDLCRFVTETLYIQKEGSETSLVTFSVVEMLRQYNSSQLALAEAPTITDMEEALLYLSKTELLKLEGGFLVIYNTMQLNRLAERRNRYGKEQYRMLDEFYKQRIQQIHIVGEYANLMVRDYDAALQYVSDYFLMDFKAFIEKYFKGERKNQINKNITPAKYDKIFGTLSTRQLAIINDRQSKYIVVAAGPGSGKTRVLVHKLASLLLLEDVKHEQLLMLTFSRSAATEFKKRLIELVGNAAHFVDIKTFHSYSFDIIGRQGNLEEAGNVVGRAAEMIMSNEVETSKIAKSVLVIDEAQDMGHEDFQLVQALMQRNEEMRVIAVGDDDQNIYSFRGSNSVHMRTLITSYGATLYEMTDNYRSSRAIVDIANRFVKKIPHRMKRTPIVAVTDEEGKVEYIPEKDPFEIHAAHMAGNTAVLTHTNEEAMQVAYLIEQQGLHAKLIQSTDGFRFGNLAEVRYFMKCIQLAETDEGEDTHIVSKKQWQDAKQRTMDYYATSQNLDILQHFFSDFEETHQTYYRSDLKEYITESNIEDFIATDDKTILVSTIHKAKGREFDTVYLFPPKKDKIDEDVLRVVYVGITRAKKNLFLLKGDGELQDSSIAIALTHRDVWLDYFRDKKEAILRLRSGDELLYHNGYLTTQTGVYVAALSSAMKTKLITFEQKGYKVTRATVGFVVAWRPKNDDMFPQQVSVTEPTEYAVCLANLFLEKQKGEA